MKPHKVSTHLAFSDNCYFHSFFIGCLIELKFCEDSRNLISNWCWKFQLSILKNKKVLFPKNIFFEPLSISKQKSLFTDPIFSEGFVISILFFRHNRWRMGHWWAIRQKHASYHHAGFKPVSWKSESRLRSEARHELWLRSDFSMKLTNSLDSNLTPEFSLRL